MKFFKNNKIKVLVTLIFLISFFLRFYKVADVPPALYWDEVSQGYNAYSILTTGHDEHKEFMPLARFVAFGDYKAPVYTYLIVPFMAFLGKGELAVRLPSVVLGSFTVLYTFFLTREIFYKERLRDIISLLSAFFLAISPWHIQLSRGAFEGNVATFFTILGIFLFIFSIRRSAHFFILGVISLVLAFYSFNSHRVFIPLLTIFLSIIYFKELWRTKRSVIIGGVIGILLLVPYLLFFTSPESRIRFQEVNIFSDLSIIERTNALQAKENNSLLSKAVHNRRVVFALEYVQNYFDFYNPNFLFFEGDINTRFSHRNNGQLYLWQLPLILIGIYQIAKGEKRAYIIFGWLLLAPVAAATARETPHALRAETFLPIFSIFTSVGVVTLICYAKKNTKLIYLLSISAVSITVLFSLFAFIYNYFTHFPKEFSHDWQYGYKEMITKVTSIEDDYDNIYVTRTLGRPYVYFLFYGDYTTQEFWNDSEVERDILGLYNVNRIGKIHFVEVIPNDVKDNSLVIGNPEQIPDNYQVIDIVKFLNGRIAFEIAEK